MLADRILLVISLSQQYDHTVKARQSSDPYKARDGKRQHPCLRRCWIKAGIVLSHALAPDESDPYGMAKYVIEQAIQNSVAIGADPNYITAYNFAGVVLMSPSL